MFDQEPVGSFFAITASHPNEHKAAVQARTIERELEVAFRQRLLRGLIAFRLPVSAIPKHDRAPAVLTFRDRSFEVPVVQRVIFDLNG